MSYTNTLSHTRFANGPSGQLGLLALDWYDTEHDFSGLGFMKSGVPREGGKGRDQGQSGGIGRGGPGVNPD